MKKGNSDVVDIAGELRHETERAFLFYDGKETVWLPKSLCEWDQYSGTITLPEWLAMEKGLI